MLTRPGSKPGPAWMRRFSERSAETNERRRSLPFWLFFVIYMAFILVVIHLATAVVFSGERSYSSPAQIAGIPLLSYGSTAKGVIAVGRRATGIVAVGGLAIGVVAIGGLAIGALGFGGVSLAVVAMAGLAIGWRAVGALAIGDAALGGLAIGKYAYAGNGVAYGSLEASGRQKEHLT
ncbi:MAG TPA: hypothetical protein VMU53_10945 [Candidatus Sulfotelmatobacter sp.]|nr:hypothetical protein [Candidatus Sulfotelmatobacter sp.]